MRDEEEALVEMLWESIAWTDNQRATIRAVLHELRESYVLVPRGSRPLRVLCLEHDGFTHGAEAEELRAGIEAVLADSELWEGKKGRIGQALQRVLDSVDARDSLAFLELEGS